MKSLIKLVVSYVNLNAAIMESIRENVVPVLSSAADVVVDVSDFVIQFKKDLAEDQDMKNAMARMKKTEQAPDGIALATDKMDVAMDRLEEAFGPFGKKSKKNKKSKKSEDSSNLN